MPKLGKVCQHKNIFNDATTTENWSRLYTSIQTQKQNRAIEIVHRQDIRSYLVGGAFAKGKYVHIAHFKIANPTMSNPLMSSIVFHNNNNNKKPNLYHK